MEAIDNIFADMDTTMLAIVSVVCAFLPLVVFFGSLKLHTIYRVNKYNANLRAKDEPRQPKWVKLKPRVAFTMKDTRPIFPKKGEEVDVTEEPKKPLITRRLLFFILIALSLASGPGLLFAGMATFAFIVPTVLFIAGMEYAIHSPVKIMAQRDKMYTSMYKIAQSTLGVEEELRGNIYEVVKVTKWAPDGLTPLNIDFAVPPTFNAGGQQNFIELFNQNYGINNAWVARSVEKGVPGWDYENNVVHMYSVPPIPQIAPWHERYVLTEGIAWSFFPCGLGAENGVEMVNPETGKKEYVLGFDLSGEQKSVGEKAGLTVSPEITTSPMALVAGGTGSGKAIACDEPIAVIKNHDLPA